MYSKLKFFNVGVIKVSTNVLQLYKLDPKPEDLALGKLKTS